MSKNLVQKELKMFAQLGPEAGSPSVIHPDTEAAPPFLWPLVQPPLPGA